MSEIVITDGEEVNIKEKKIKKKDLIDLLDDPDVIAKIKKVVLNA